MLEADGLFPLLNLDQSDFSASASGPNRMALSRGAGGSPRLEVEKVSGGQHMQPDAKH
jgi:hypothetical protein